MKPKLEPCTKGPKHKWEFVRNKEVMHSTPTTMSITLKGVYRCACGARKLGDFRHEAPAAPLLVP